MYVQVFREHTLTVKENVSLHENASLISRFNIHSQIIHIIKVYSQANKANPVLTDEVFSRWIMHPLDV